MDLGKESKSGLKPRLQLTAQAAKGLPVWKPSMSPAPCHLSSRAECELWHILSFQIYKCDWDFFLKSDLWCGYQYYSTGVFRKLVAAVSNQTRRRCFRSPRKSARSIPDAFWVCWGLHPSLAQCPRPLIPSTDLSSHILVSWVHFLHTQHSLVVAGEKKDKTKPQYNTPEYLSTWVPHGGGQR